MYSRRLIHSLDERLARLSLGCVAERNSFLIFLFHGLFENAEELQSGVVDPQQGITVEMLRAFVRYFKSQSYRFVSPSDIAAGLSTEGRYVLLTFDDGYYSNLRALPILEEFDAPAVFFIATAHVKQRKSFWWDIVYRAENKRGRTVAEVRSVVASYKRLKTAEVETHLRKTLGEGALSPIGDLDRTFSPSELREFARHKYVFLGNHTRDHTILTNYSHTEIREQISGAQDDIKEMTGQIPVMIAYPNGNASAEIQHAALEAGLHLAVGVRPGKNELPFSMQSKHAMSLKRYTLWGDRGIEEQCRISRSGLSFYRLLQGVKDSAHAGL